MASSQREQLIYATQELQRSRSWRNQDQHDALWRRLIDLYRGKHYSGTSPNDRLIVNMAFATKNVLGPAVAIHNPRFIVDARKPENAANAIVTAEVLNYLWRTHRYQSEFRLAVDDFICIGHGWLKVGYKFVKEPEVKASTDESQPEDAPAGVDDRDDVEGNVESEMHVDDDRPFVERLSPFDIFVDPEARHPKEMRWIAQRTWRPIVDVRVDGRYSATVRARVPARSYSRFASLDRDARDQNERADSGPLAFAEIIEFYDLRRGTVSTFAMPSGDVESHDGFLIKPKPIPYGTGHPFVMLRNYEVPDHFYPIGDLEQIESLQLELNETRTQMMNHRKRFARKWLYERDAFDGDGIKALESETDNVMIPVLSDGAPGNVIAPVPAVITPPEFYNQSELISVDMDRVSGVSDYQRGSTEIKRTATEAAMIQDSVNARAQDRLAKIEDILAQVGERVIGLMQQYLTGEHVARITSVPGAAWFTYKREYIEGKFDFEVQGGSTEPRNETFRRQSAMQLVDASMPFLDMGVANPVALYRQVLSGFGIKNTSEIVQPMPPPAPPAEPPMPEQMPPGMPPGMVPPDMGMPPGAMPGMVPGPGGAVPLPPDAGTIPPEMLMAMLAGAQGMPPMA